MARFNLDNYEPVEDRLARFWDEHPEGARVLTELVKAEGGEFIVKAIIFENLDDDQPIATGYAHELVGSTPVNKTSALENCETSAIGRALANMGYAPKGARPSREEMEKATRAEAIPAPPTCSEEQRNAIREAAKSVGLAGKALADYISTELGRTVTGFGGVTPEEGDRILTQLLAQGIAAIEAKPAANSPKAN